jgi:stage V sporulation protein G
METPATELEVKRLIRFDGDGNLKAYCDLAIGNAFLVKGLRVLEGKNGLFVSMPRQQGKDQKWYDSVLALTKEARQAVGRVVLDAYHHQPLPDPDQVE